MVGTRTRNTKSWSCGGTLITEWAVLTVARCLKGYDILRVRLGENTVNGANGSDCLADGSFCLPSVQDFDIQPRDVILHPQYQRDVVLHPQYQRDFIGVQIQNNIALIRLPRRAVLNAGVQIACLSPNPFVIANTHILGWSYTTYDPLGPGGPLFASWDPRNSRRSDREAVLQYLVGVDGFGTRSCATDKPDVYTRVSS